MKKKLLALLMIGSVVVGSSCSKIKEATNQDVTITPNSITVTAAANNNTNAVSIIGSETVNLDLNTLIKEKASSFGINNVKSVKLNSLTAEIIEGADADNNFANLENVSAEIEAAGKTSTLMASFSHSVTTRVDKITVPASGNVELKDLVTGTGIKYILKGKLKKATTKPLKIKVTASYNLVVGL